jgi:hypothetical protein
MAVTLKCPDCGHTEQSEDGGSKTCPECEGIMAVPVKKKYQAKTTSLEEEERARKKKKRSDEDEDEDEPKAKRKRDEDEDEDERPKAKKRSRDDDDDDERGGGDSTCDGKAAKAFDLNPGFKNKALMKQAMRELSRGEVLHFICRPSKDIARMQGFMLIGVGIFVALLGIGVGTVMLTVANVPAFALVVPVLFVLFGIVFGILGPIMKNRQAKLGWYAVTDRRAIVFNVALWGKSGHCESYSPSDLRKMWIKKSMWVKGGGDLIFKTETTYSTRTVRTAHGGTRTETTQSTQYYGFIGIEDVKDVERLIHEVLLTRRRRKDEDDDDEDDDD